MSGRITLLLFGAAAFLYSIPALVLMAIFPRADGSLSGVKLSASGFYALGSLFLLLFAVIGLSRISAIKDRPRLKMLALVRLLAGIVPMLAVSALVLLMINRAPTLSLEVIDPPAGTQLIAPLPVTFGMQTALRIFQQQQLTPLRYEWDFNGDGAIDQQTFDPQATFLVSNAGIYPIAARVTMTSGVQKQVVYRLVVPRASFGLQPPSPIIDELVTFSLDHLFPKGTDAPTLQKARWDFDGDGTVDLETEKPTATTIYHKLGPVNVAVTMTLSNQTQSTLQRMIVVTKPPEQPYPITLETEPQTLLGPPPFGVVFTLKTKEPIANVSWEFDDGKVGEGLRIAHVFASVKNYTVTAAARSQSGAIAKLSKIVRVTNPLNIPDLTFEGKPEVRGFAIDGQVPLTVDITPVTSQPLISFSWDAPNASEVLATDKSFHAVYRDEGRFFVDLIGMDPDQNVFRRRITITTTPAESMVKFSMDPATPTAPALVTFDASDTFVPLGEQITGFEWDFGDGSSAGNKFSGSRIEHQFTRPGTYGIGLSVHTTSNQTYSGRQTLVVKAPLIDACFLASRSSGSAPLGVRFDAGCSTGDFIMWLWDFGDGAQSDAVSPTHVFLTAGTFTVTLTATTSDGLVSTKTGTITVLSQ